MITPRPNHDILLELELSTIAYIGMLASSKLNLFSTLDTGKQTLQTLSRTLHLQDRPTSALISLGASLGLIGHENGFYFLTDQGRDLLSEKSPVNFLAVMDLDRRSFSQFEELMTRSLTTNTPQVFGELGWVEVLEREPNIAIGFTKAMHSYSIGAAMMWPRIANISDRKTMVDVGGGSGAHCIGAAQNWPNLKTILFDMEPVCNVARNLIPKNELADRIEIVSGNLWKDTLPPGDLHFYSMVFHDWPRDQCKILAQKSFDQLEPGGKIMIHEMLFEEDRLAPRAVASFNLLMLMVSEGQQYTGPEIISILEEVGFVEASILPTWGYWSIVTAIKP